VKKKNKHKMKLRNAAPRSANETPLQRLGYTAGGAAASAVLGGYLAKQGWAPKTVAGALATLGAGLTWKGDSPQAKSVGSGVMGASGGQLVMELLVDFEEKRQKKPANAQALPPGSLESALERARQRLAAAT
jgi:hypothetical protein